MCNAGIRRGCLCTGSARQSAMKCFIIMMFSFLYFGFFSPNIKIVTQHYPLVPPFCPLPLIKSVPGHAIHLLLPYRTLRRTAAPQPRRSLYQGQHLLHWLRRRTLNYEKTEDQSQSILVRYVLVLGFFKLCDSAKPVQRAVTVTNTPIVPSVFGTEFCCYRFSCVGSVSMGF